jgi:hypothetical protein
MTTDNPVGTVRMRHGAHPLSNQERAVFGENAPLHPITGRPLERARGSPPDDAQARGHLRIMLDELRALYRQCCAETDAGEKRERVADYQATAKHVADVAGKLGIALNGWEIPQLLGR